MPVDFNEAHHLISEYEDVHRARHEAFRALRKYWHGDYWKMADYEQSRPITSIFRDLTQHMSDIGPEIKLVHNVIQQVCVKYQTFLSPLPQIRVWVDPPETDTRRAQASRKQRFLYGTWAQGNMDRIFNRAGWYLPLMGDCFLGIHPDFDKKLPTPLIRSPEFAYPIPSFDKQGEQAICFRWKVAESVAAKNFVEYTAPIEQMRTDRRGRFRRGQPVDPQIEVVEYSDGDEWHRWLAQIGPRTSSQKMGELIGKPVEVNGVVHNFGFNLFEHLKFIDVPDEVWGHGAVEQAINLNEMGNALYSLLFQSVIENVFPRLVLIDPAKAPEEIETGPGAVIPINQGGAVEWLHPPVQALGMQQQFSSLNDHNIKDVSGMPEVNFGESPATSIVTGKAINELQGAGTGSMVEMVQGVGIGNGIVNWNEKALSIGQRLFRDDTMYLYGSEYTTTTALVPQRFALTLKGKDLVGSPRNEVIFAPAISQHEKLVMNLQGLGAGLWSKKYVREQQGIPDNDAMEQELLAEAITDTVIGAMMQSVQQQPTPDQAAQVEGQAFSYLQGANPTGRLRNQNQAPLPGPAPHPLLALNQAPPGPATQAPPQGAPPTGSAPAAPPPASAQAAGGGQGNVITLSAATAAFQQVQGVQGRVFLVGQIVVRQQTSDSIEVAVTEPADRNTLAQGLPQYAGRLQFTQVQDEPSEPFVEVTPGSAPRRGGSAQASPEALHGLMVQ